MDELIEELKQAALIDHYTSPDCWYSCPKSGKCCDDAIPENTCTCIADDHNKKVITLINKLKDRIDNKVFTWNKNKGVWISQDGREVIKPE